jgi:Xaa-Pro dipeptidase
MAETAKGSAVPQPGRERRHRLVTATRDSGCDAAVICSGGNHSLLAMDGVWWTTGFKPMGDCAAGIGPDGSARLWVTPAWDAPRAEAIADAGVTVIAAESRSAVFGAASSWLAGLGVPVSRTLVCGAARLAVNYHRELAGALGDGWKAGDRILAEAARARDAAERELATEAVHVAEAAFARLLPELRPGVDEFVVAASLDALLRELGSEDNFVLISASRRNHSVHPPTERPLQPGDVLLAEISPSRHGVFTQICRTAVIGPCSGHIADDYELLMTALKAGLDACRPGAPVPAVAQAMDTVLGEAGFAGYCRPPYMRARGHALGIGSALPGDVTQDSGEVFCEGDYLVVHPNQYLPASGYLLCGEPVIVEAAGARQLSSCFGELVQVAV